MAIQDALKQKRMSVYRLAKASEVPYATVNEIAGNLQKKTDRASILAKLRERKTEVEQKAATLKRGDPER